MDFTGHGSPAALGNANLHVLSTGKLLGADPAARLDSRIECFRHQVLPSQSSLALIPDRKVLLSPT